MTNTTGRECMDDHRGDCDGDVEYRMNLSGTGVPTVRCDKHWGDRLDLQDEINRKYAPDSDVPPTGFREDDAGERWSDDY
jgi:hypothetical protein